MKKITFIIVFAIATLPFTGCNNSGDQSAYMHSPGAEQNAREAEQAEEEFAQLAKQSTSSKKAHGKSQKSAKAEKGEKAGHSKKAKSVAQHESKQEQQIREIGEKVREHHEQAEHHEAPAKHEAREHHEVPAHHEEKTAHHEAPAHHEASAHHETAHQTSTGSHERTPASTPAKHVADVSEKAWTVNLGAFRVKENAERYYARVKKEGFPVVLRQMNHSKNGEIFVVHLEPTPNKSEAQKWQTDLKLKSFDSVLTSKKED